METGQENGEKILKNPVIKEFLKDEKNKVSLERFLNIPTKENLEHLNDLFAKFYRINRVIRYMSGLIKRYPIDYDKRVKLRNKRYQLIMDKPVNGKDESGTATLSDIVAVENKTPLDQVIKQENRKEMSFEIKTDFLHDEYKNLADKQREIIYMYYEQGFNNREIGEKFNQTEQNIRYWHDKTIKQLQGASVREH